jgi:hypothetical protein
VLTEERGREDAVTEIWPAGFVTVLSPINNWRWVNDVVAPCDGCTHPQMSRGQQKSSIHRMAMMYLRRRDAGSIESRDFFWIDDHQRFCFSCALGARMKEFVSFQIYSGPRGPSTLLLDLE